MKDWVSAETITAAKLEQDPRALRNAVDDLRSYLADNEANFSDSSAPNDAANGFTWHDSSGNTLEFRRSSAWEQVLTKGTAGTFLMTAGGGAGTVKLGGTINVDLVLSLDTTTIPANTLAADGDFLRQVIFHTDIQVARFRWGAVPTLLITHYNNATSVDALMKSFVVRTSSGNQKWVSFLRYSRDDIANTSLVGSGISSEDDAAQLKIGVSNINGGSMVSFN